MSRRRGIASLYLRIFRTYRERSASLLLLGAVVFVPIGLIEALAAEVSSESLDFGDGFKVAAVMAAFSLVSLASLFGEVFYSGAVAISLTLSEDEEAPSLREVSKRLNYRRLIAVDIVFFVLLAVGLAALYVPGILVFVWLGLSGPVVELEGRSVRGALARSFQLVRGNFWHVFWILVPIQLISDEAAEALEVLVHHSLGDSLLAGWLAQTSSDLITTPFFAIAAVLLTIELASIRDPVPTPAAAAGSPAPPATRSR